MIARTLKDTDGPRGIQPAGTEINHKDAWRLVVAGVAEPADRECQDTIDALGERQAAREARRFFVTTEREELAAAQRPAGLLPHRGDPFPIEVDADATDVEDAT